MPVANHEETLPKLLKKVASWWPEISAQMYKDSKGDLLERSYHELYQSALDFGGALLEMGVKRGERIGLISENRKEWEECDIGLLAVGAVDTPRGCDATESDLSYILSFSECQICVVENEAQAKKIAKIKKNIPTLESVIYFDDIAEETKNNLADQKVGSYKFDELVLKGREWRKLHPDAVEQELEKGKKDDLCTIIFTSGTTGTPKGVMLSHKNILTNVLGIKDSPEDHWNRALSWMPLCHIYERMMNYLYQFLCMEISYAESLAKVAENAQETNPYIMAAVPRFIEKMYDKLFRKGEKLTGLKKKIFTCSFAPKQEIHITDFLTKLWALVALLVLLHV